MRHRVTIDPSSGYEDIESAIAELEAKLHSAKRKSAAEPAESDSLVVPAVITTDDTQTVNDDDKEKPTVDALTYNCAGVGDVTVGDKDPRAAQRRKIGSSVNVPNRLWAGYETSKSRTSCIIVGYSATTQIEGAIKPGAYVVEANPGEYYAFDAAFHLFTRPKGQRK